MSAEGAGRVEVVALDGMPEIRAGDDLPGLIGDALGRHAPAYCR